MHRTDPGFSELLPGVKKLRYPLLTCNTRSREKCFEKAVATTLKHDYCMISENSSDYIRWQQCVLLREMYRRRILRWHSNIVRSVYLPLVVSTFASVLHFLVSTRVDLRTWMHGLRSDRPASRTLEIMPSEIPSSSGEAVASTSHETQELMIG